MLSTMRGAIGELTGGSRRREEEKGEEKEEEEDSDVGIFEVNKSTRAFIEKIKSWCDNSDVQYGRKVSFCPPSVTFTINAIIINLSMTNNEVIYTENIKG